MLSRAQSRALAHVRSRARADREAARARIAALLARAGGGLAVDELVERLHAHSRVTSNFHPDRLGRDGKTVAEGLLGEGRYRSQFETGITNGSPTAFAGGDRDLWEEKLFGLAYKEPAVGAEERPKYGALDLMHHADGGSPRFGSCHLVLRREVARRCTFTWGDSHEAPAHAGTSDAFEPIAAALLDSLDAKREALGRSDLGIAELVRMVSSEPVAGAHGRALDAYVEAQVHGDIQLSADVEAVVVDPSFEGTPTGERLLELSSRYGVALRHHPGFALLIGDVPGDFRGPRMVPLARRVARFCAVADRLDAATLGRAAESLEREPQAWSDWGTPRETWQHIKQLWHVLVRFGRPLEGLR